MNLLEQTIENIKPVDRDARKKAKERLDNLTMPHWALGRLMDLAVDLAGITGSLNPPLEKKSIVLFAGDHGITEEGVSKYPSEVTVQMVYNIVRGGAGINALAGNSRIITVDMGVDGEFQDLLKEKKIRSCKIATRNMAQGPAMSREEAVRAVESGIRVAEELADETDVFGTGDMGIGNTFPSSAILTVLTGCSPAEAVGPGTGLDEKQVKQKISVLEAVLEKNNPDPSDGLDVLAKVGGFEIGGIAGLILGGAALGKPVVLDGFISTAGCMIAHALCPRTTEYSIAAHRSAEPGHKLMNRHLDLEPYLNLGFRLGEGTGAALSMRLLDGAKNILTKVTTFEEAAVSRADK
jgi:nicotinate-nucleotide--dimethylbenzimidazole phosphoribosyltransferase